MTDPSTQPDASRPKPPLIGRVAGFLAPRRVRQSTFRIAFLAIAVAIAYWGLFASDRYVSEAHVIIQRTDLAGGQGMDFGSILPGVTGGARSDQMLLRDHLLSVDMLRRLDSALDLRAHYSDRSRDILSRMWSAENSLEHFHRHFRSRVAVDFDEYAGVLVIRAQAYDPDTAHAIGSMLVQEGERYMNDMAHRLAREQVGFLEQQVVEMSERVIAARQAVLAFQNERGLASPEASAENLTAVINRLEAQLSDLRARRTALLGYLSPKAPGVVEVDLLIGSVEQQIAREQARLAAPNGATLNQAVEEFQRLQLTAEFAQDVYRSSLVALEKGRVEATRTLKKVSVLQSPTVPEYPLEPRRMYNIVVFVLLALLVAGIVHLLAAIIRDHKD